MATDPETLIEGADGGEIRIIRKEDSSPWAILEMAVEPPDEEPVYYSDRSRTRQSFGILESLEDRVDNFKITSDSETVPVNIITEGQPATVCYLYAVHGWSLQELSNVFGIQPNTARQYLSAVEWDRR